MFLCCQTQKINPAKLTAFTVESQFQFYDKIHCSVCCTRMGHNNNDKYLCFSLGLPTRLDGRSTGPELKEQTASLLTQLLIGQFLSLQLTFGLLLLACCVLAGCTLDGPSRKMTTHGYWNSTALWLQGRRESCSQTQLTVHSTLRPELTRVYFKSMDWYL